MNSKNQDTSAHHVNPANPACATQARRRAVNPVQQKHARIANLVNPQDDSYGSFVSDLEKLERKIAEVYAAVPYVPKRVRFEPMQTQSPLTPGDNIPPGTTSSAGADPEATVPALSNEMLRDALRNTAALGMENQDYAKIE